mmetsp:Transcript_33221/g.61180  ORF Transcript_33221/g.61180 Transcript_33221/m.61180 type:complete len:82 (+) Transcript_33221:161-406(+)|eukprot:CAMPEP_0197441230 /NCGR_PEP_ID=MMETSP1175-20131217/7551_1 /TAXON_ID=1003142 /ORGANISM="Triceratium dubium, Strain CCMP147" /LENGTH=81 /DNA_ID=CAMNT_0042971477 /DNA_START=109 /DNA_END=354 /DNA_ORIENTATION=+
MKIAVALLALPALASAFAPSVSRPAFSTTRLAVTTGPNGKPAKDAKEDLELTYQVIMDNIAAEDESEDAPAPSPAPAADEE